MLQELQSFHPLVIEGMDDMTLENPSLLPQLSSPNCENVG